MRVAIIGSRELNGEEERCYEIICETVPANCTEIVSGGASGIDELAEKYAREHSLLFKRFEPEYHRYAKNAPLVRNEEIIRYANFVLVFWDGDSRGTAYVINKCWEIDRPIETFII